MPTPEYRYIIQKLDDFIRRFYLNEIYKGSLLLLFVFLVSTLLVFLIEYFSHLSVFARTFIFYALLVSYVAILIKYIFLPLLSLFNIRKGINHLQAAQIISRHFEHLKDSFINTLELAHLPQHRYSSQLLLASIDQRITEIKPLPFQSAIDFKETVRFLKFLGISFVIYLLVWLYKPAIIEESSQRLIHHRTEFVPPAPFSFLLLNQNLTALQGSDIDLSVMLQGSYIPQKVYIHIGSARLLLNQTDKNIFSYTIKGINRSTEFFFEADGYRSKPYQITMVLPPTIINFKTEIIPPAYTGIKPTLVENTGDITAPAGSIIFWTFQTAHTDSLIFLLNDSLQIPTLRKDKEFLLKRSFFKSANYSVIPANRQVISNKPMVYQIHIIPDAYPSIQADFITDSTMWGTYYFKGSISDDYGFKRLNFVLRYAKDSVKEISIPIQPNILNQEFYFTYDFASLKNFAGSIEYYFEVWDNDGVNGSKSAKSQIKTFKIPDKQELEKMRTETTQSIIKQLEQSEKTALTLEKELRKLQQNLTNSSSVSWEHTQKFQQLMQQQLQLEKTLKQLSEQNKQKNNMLRTFSEQDQQILEKQQQIQQLLENLLDDELKKLIEQLQEMMKNIDKNKLQQLTQEFKMQTEEIQKELDRTLELLKKMDIEEKMSQITENLKELAQQQEQLSEQSLDKKIPLDSLKQQQQQHQEKFNELKQQYQELMKQNNQLSDPFSMQSFQEEQQSIEKEMQQGQMELQDNNRKGASKNQKNTSHQLKQLSQKMQQMMQQNAAQQQAEDEESLKHLLENIKSLSFTQEDLMLKTRQIKPYEPQYQQVIQQQNNIRGNIKVIEDSLNALAKRNPMISNTVNKHLKNLKTYTQQTMKHLDERNPSQAAIKQQLAMTESNELALLLSQILKQMQESSSEQLCSGGQCKKKSKGQPKPGYQQIKNMQQQLKQQLQSILQEMKNQQQQNQGQKLSEQLGKMISMQDKMQQMLNEMMQEPGISPESMKKLQEIKNLMNDVQKDIANKNITPQTLQRQEQILTRLLEAEKSDNERETENKRESESGKNDKISNPKEIFQYKGKKSIYDEILQQSNLPLQKYYQELYRKYMINLNQ
ncbi:MAG: hypothetical protein N2449_00385 [Bacteroidales bacterium]|nr:hypothetical protein [Bacteroidales bacterium]